MKNQRILFTLTLVNLGLFIYQIGQLHIANAASSADEVAPMLRGRGLEIVDDEGRLRAQITMYPADDKVTMPNGKTEPETVIFRLCTPDGKPRVKIDTSDQGSGICLVGEDDSTHIILQANLKSSSLKLKNDEATEKFVKP